MRIVSIDVFRAITMLLMIWVNDFHTIIGVPKWLTHASATEDYMGFSDTIFPLFLFIVGLSIPLAIAKRMDSGESRISIAKHVALRSFSLLLIGVYMVNYETAHHESIVVGKYGWCILMALAVVLIWMNWKRSPVSRKWHNMLQGLGIVILIFLAVIYKGGSAGELWMTTQWWGILGLIGWAYLANAMIYLLAKGNSYIVVATFLLFFTLSVLKHLDFLPQPGALLSYFSTLYSGTIPAFTAMGMVATLLFRSLKKRPVKFLFPAFFALGFISLLFGLLTRPIWGISKIQATPSWLTICIAIGLFVFPLLYYLIDVKKHRAWASIIMPAGTATLTCYLIPYFIYPLKAMTGIRLPDIMNTGVFGLIGSFIFALLVVIFTGWLERKGFKLKL